MKYSPHIIFLILYSRTPEISPWDSMGILGLSSTHCNIYVFNECSFKESFLDIYIYTLKRMTTSTNSALAPKVVILKFN